ncbi:dipeptide ABC transporter ATP-binding protein [Catenulispora yoronensis]|uniref:Dipeptide ABC transporter ATP-binding protein n=1 Tax=Catenulispora yoronensis TaxID=450799 RepID=A0ABN2TP06_9ACTN
MADQPENDAGTAPPLVSLDRVVKEYPVAGPMFRRAAQRVHAVSDVSLVVPQGASFGLVGESGCGKSTLGRLIVGLERPTSGTIQVAGEDTTRLRGADRRRFWRDVQLVFQDPRSSLDPRMKIAASLGEPLAVQREQAREQRRRLILDLLDEVGLPADAMRRYPHEMSGGQLQRVGIARALAVRPRLVVADEPVSGLDVSVRAQVLNLMRTLQRAHGITYIVISHDLTTVRYFADHVGVMYLGKLVETGPVASVYTRPAHPYTAALLAAIPHPDPRRERHKESASLGGDLPSAVDPPSGCRFRTRCPLATELCAVEEPRPRNVAPGHQVACHFPLPSPSPAAETQGPR